MMNEAQNGATKAGGLTDEPLNEKDAAARLGLTAATLRAWRHQRRGPAFVRLGRAVRYLASDIDKFVHANRHDVPSVD